MDVNYHTHKPIFFGLAPPIPYHVQEKIYKGDCKTHSNVPADAVSLRLAYKNFLEPLQLLAQTANLRHSRPSHAIESSLHFGPKTLPAVCPLTLVENNVHEERLNIVDKPIVEFKAPSIRFPGTLSPSGCNCDTDDEETSRENAGSYISLG